jgi:hypothetical protein
VKCSNTIQLSPNLRPWNLQLMLWNFQIQYCSLSPNILFVSKTSMQTITSLKLNLFSFFIYCCDWISHVRKMICNDIFLLSDRQWSTEHQYLLICFLGVSLMQSTYNRPHTTTIWFIEICNSIHTKSRLPNNSDVKTGKRRNRIGLTGFETSVLQYSF